MSQEESSLTSLSLDYLNLLINGEAFGDVTFSVEGHLVHAHRCILAARSIFFRKFFCGAGGDAHLGSPPGLPFPTALSPNRVGGAGKPPVISVNSVGYEVFLLLLQFLYSGQVSIAPQKQDAGPTCAQRGCRHAHCSTTAIDLALDTYAAAQAFGVQQLALLSQTQLEEMVEKASIEDVMKVLLATARKQEMQQLWTKCSHLVANSGLQLELLEKHLPVDVVMKIEELRIELDSSSLTRRSASFVQQRHPLARLHHPPLGMGPPPPSAGELVELRKIRRMRRALDAADMELVKLMVMGEGLDLDAALALHYAVESCSREVVKALLELGAVDVNHPAGPAGKTPLHVAAEMVSPDMVAVLLDHHADPTVGTIDGVTPLDILRALTSEFLFKGAIPGLVHIEPNKLRLCLELVQSAATVLAREEASFGGSASVGKNHHLNAESSGSKNVNHTSNADAANLTLDSRMVYLNLGIGAAGAHLGFDEATVSREDDVNSRHRRRNSGVGAPRSIFSHEFLP